MSAIEPPSQTTVLVVEDEVILRMDAVDLIADAGFGVYDAENADEAMEILERQPDIRIVFTDIDMPGSMDGLELARRVHRRWPDIKIVITSGHRKAGEVDFLCDGLFLPKPCPAAGITKALSDAVARA